MIDLESLFKFGAEGAEHLFNKQGRLTPMWIGLNEKGHRQPLLISGQNDKDTVSIVKQFLRDKKIVAYVSTVECRERLIVIAEDKDGRAITGDYPILRSDHKRPTLSPLKRHRKKRLASMFI